VEQREEYFGYGMSGVDEKGRVAVPAGLRATIELNSNARFLIISKHPTAECLMCFDREFRKNLLEFMVSVAGEGETVERRLTRSELARKAGVCDELPYDSSGRFVLPPFMRQTSKIGAKALFIGAMDVIEIWNPEIALTADCVPDTTRELADYLLKSGK